ncbi:MAG: SPOR domain-containing protein [Flavobacteriaceae bacterium]
MKKRINYKSFIFLLLAFISVQFTFGQKATVTINEDAKIPEILELKKSMEADNKLSVGFTIQLYYGELNEAHKIMKEYKTNYDSWPASIEYETPNYKVWVGSFSSRFEADHARLEINNKFPDAFILPVRR